MPLIQFIAVLVAVGILLWLVNTYVTIMDPTVKKILNIAVIIGVVLWVLSVFGVLPAWHTIRIGA